MADLAYRSAAEQLGFAEADPFRMVAPGGIFLVSGASEQAPNSIVAAQGGYACWLASRRRLVVGARPGGDFVSDVTDGTAVFELAEHGMDFLAMGCTLTPDAVAVGRCAQTMFAGQRLLLARPEAHLLVFAERPIAPYLRDWFRQAATTLAGTRS